VPPKGEGISRLAEAVGRTGTLRTREEKFKIKVRILDARRVYGRLEYLVTPEGGEGKAWTAATRVRLER
jgi:hypothetical protein